MVLVYSGMLFNNIKELNVGINFYVNDFGKYVKWEWLGIKNCILYGFFLYIAGIKNCIYIESVLLVCSFRKCGESNDWGIVVNSNWIVLYGKVKYLR